MGISKALVSRGGRANAGVGFRIFFACAALFAGLLLSGTPAFSQVNLGRVDGTITDQSGGAVAGATVVVLDIERGVPRQLTTDDSGTYSAAALIPGNYSVRVEAKGFRTVERKDVGVGVGQDLRVDITLQPGEQTQLVTVTGEVPEVNTTNAQLGGTIENQTIQDLPVAGRTFLALANYRPGVLTNPGAGGGLVQYTNGMRPDYNVFVFDGLPDVNSFGNAGPLNIGFQAGGPDESVILSVDAIQEMNLVENPKAEYGWRPGAQVNIGLKSGTNTIHGTAFALGRGTGMQARNPFSAVRAQTEFEQFGATVGGPIKRDKLFYMLSYEQQRYTVGNPKTLGLPTTVSLLGTGNTAPTSNSFPDAIADLNTRGIALNQLSLNLAGCTRTGVCTPSAGLFSNTQTGPAATTAPINFPVIGGSKNGVAKFDYHFNEHNNFNIDFFQGRGIVNAPVASVSQQYWAPDITGSVTVGRVVWSYVPNTSWVNEVRAGWDYSLQVAGSSADCINHGAPNYAGLGFTSGATLCGFPNLVISGFGSATAPTLGEAVGINAKSINYSISDNVSYSHGNHLFRFGFQYTHQIFNGQTLQYLNKGTLQFNAVAAAGTQPALTPLEAFLTGRIFSESLQIGNLQRTAKFEQYSTYIQDDWRIKPRLTLNLGLRYEFQSPIKEDHNLIAKFDPNSPGGLTQSNGNSLYRSYPLAFSPRFGLAWDVTGKGTTVVHAGYVFMYFQPTASEFLSFNNSINLAANPTGGQYQRVAGGPRTSFGGTIDVQNQTLLSFNPFAVNQPVFTAPASPVCGPGGAGNPSPCKVYGVGHLTIPEFGLWNLGIQHSITNNLTMDVSYVGNHGQHLFGPVDINAPTPGAAGAAAEQARRPLVGQFPYFSNIIILSNPGRSNYEGLQATLTERASHGLTFSAGYTYAHSFDMQLSEVAAAVPQNSLNPADDYGNSSVDVRHRFTFQGTYTVPGKKTPLHILEGWQITTANQFFSARPYNAVDPASDISGTGEGQDRWDLFGNPNDFKPFSGPASLPFFAGTSNPACVTAAAQIPTGPTGQTGAQALAAHGCYVAGNSYILAPTQGTFGNMERYTLRGKGFRVWDLTLVKNIPLKERLTAQFRAECYNVLNSVQYATPNGNPAQSGTFGKSSGTPNIIANSPIIGNGDARRFQLGLRFQF